MAVPRATSVWAQVRRLRSYARRGTSYLSRAERYLRFRRTIPRRYAALSLDRLLEELSEARSDGRVLSVSELGAVIRAAERLAPRLSPAPNTCLFRALARFATLVADGHRPVFLLGMANDRSLPAHAWVELRDEPFLESARVPFVSVFRYRAGDSSSLPAEAQNQLRSFDWGSQSSAVR
jgi:hypothetical protein